MASVNCFSQQGKQRRKKQQMEKKNPDQIHIGFNVDKCVAHKKRHWVSSANRFKGQVRSPLTYWSNRNI